MITYLSTATSITALFNCRDSVRMCPQESMKIKRKSVSACYCALALIQEVITARGAQQRHGQRAVGHLSRPSAAAACWEFMLFAFNAATVDPHTQTV
ncbi:hypothetical protein QQF64_003564 [Cirrhinus molitorella]|uniref:Secreted protein n=1 Tax=Cirrhinus molitorella TaxID=172907 RepID=A0ABR3MLQ5_9TELE